MRRPLLFCVPLAAVALLGLVACDSSIQQGPDADTSQMRIGVPAIIASSRAVVIDNLRPDVRLDGTVITLQRIGESWTGSFRMQPEEVLTLSIDWFESFRGRELQLATYSETIGPFSSDQTINLNAIDYQSGQFDDDNDGLSNLEERNNDAYDPLNAAIPGGASVPDVSIPRIAPESAPSIDGRYDAIWDQAVFTDTARESLNIDNLMRGSDPLRGNDSTEYRWAALHDGTSLYLFVSLEDSAIGTPTSDSTTASSDDAVEIFLDGDNSALAAGYDGVNDYQIILPLYKLGFEDPWEDNNRSDVDGRVEIGSLSAALPSSLDFHACYCLGGKHTLEFKVALADVGISVGEMFGIEVQYDDDRDGGDRDAKWGWKHPSKSDGGADVDGTGTNPSLMGTAMLQ